MDYHYDEPYTYTMTEPKFIQIQNSLKGALIHKDLIVSIREPSENICGLWVLSILVDISEYTELSFEFTDKEAAMTEYSRLQLLLT